MMNRGKVVITVAVCVVTFLIVGYVLGWFSLREMYVAENAVSDYSMDPVYSEYEFGRSNQMIDVGIQPMWIPTNIIMEVMRRDAVLKDTLARNRLEIRFHGFRKGVDINNYLARGDLEVGVGGDMPTLSAVVESNVVVTSVIQRGPVALVADRYLRTMDLKGLTIAYAPGSLSHYMLLRLLASAGILHNEVNMVAMDVGPMPGALARGEIDAFAAWEPTPAIALVQNPKATVIHRSTSSGYLYFSSPFARHHPDTLRQILAAQIRAMKWLRLSKDNLRTAGRWAIKNVESMFGEKITLSERAYAALALKDILGVTSFPEITVDDLALRGPLATELEFLKKLGKVPVGVKWGELKKSFNTSIVGEIVQEHKKYRLNTFLYTEPE